MLGHGGKLNIRCQCEPSSVYRESDQVASRGTHCNETDQGAQVALTGEIDLGQSKFWVLQMCCMHTLYFEPQDTLY